MNNCHKELVWLVSNMLKQVVKPIRRMMIFGPYLSRAHPPKTRTTQPKPIVIEITVEVIVRLRLNSAAMDLKKTPKERFIPASVAPVTKKAITITHP